MEQQLIFRIEKTLDGRSLFIKDEITINIQGYSCKGGVHEITYPRMASAEFECDGKKYVVSNWDCFATVEDWYLQELLAKLQLLKLLIADKPKMCE